MNAARRKVEDEGVCRICGDGPARKLDAAHVWPRSRGASGFESPDEIVPLCSRRKGGAGCHEAFDAGELDLAGLLTLEEELALVRLAYPISGRGSGIERARARIAPTATQRPTTWDRALGQPEPIPGQTTVDDFVADPTPVCTCPSPRRGQIVRERCVECGALWPDQDAGTIFDG